MKKLHLILSLLVLCTCYLNAQKVNWASKIGYTSGSDFHTVTDAAIDSFDNVYILGVIAGTTDFDPGAGTAIHSNPVGTDPFLAKYDRDGNYLWHRVFEGVGDDFAEQVDVDQNNNVYVLLKAGNSMELNPAGLTRTGYESIIAKYSSAGYYIWHKDFTGGGTKALQSLAIDSEANRVYVGGRFTESLLTTPAGMAELFASYGKGFLAAFDLNGNSQWITSFGQLSTSLGNGEVYVNDLTVDKSTGHLYVTGSFEGTTDFGVFLGPSYNSASGNAYLMKVTSGGLKVKASQLPGFFFGGTSSSGNGIDITDDGYVIAGGTYKNGSTISGGYIRKFNTNFQAVYSRYIQSFDITDVEADDEGGYLASGEMGANNIIAGTTSQKIWSTDTDAHAIVRYNADNSFRWGKSTTHGNNSAESLSRGLTYRNGSFVHTGQFKGSVDFEPCGSGGGLSVSPGNASYIFDGFFAKVSDAFIPDVQICSAPTTVEIENAPAGYTMNWTFSPSNAVTPNTGSGSSVTVSRVGNYNGTVTATVHLTSSHPHCLGDFTITKELMVGSSAAIPFLGYVTQPYNPLHPQGNGLTLVTPSVICREIPDQPIQFNAGSPPQGVLYYEWQSDLYSSVQRSYGPGPAVVDLSLQDDWPLGYYGSHYVRVRAVTSCGVSDWDQRNFVVSRPVGGCSSGGEIPIGPIGFGFNRSGNDLNGADLEKSGIDETSQIKLYNAVTGSLVYQGEMAAGKKFNTRDIPVNAGHYFLHIRNSKGITRKQIMITRE